MNRSRKIEAHYAFPARCIHAACIFERSDSSTRCPRYLEIQMRKNCSRAASYLVGIGLSIAGQGRENYARAIFSRSREYLPISVANSHTMRYPLPARRQLLQSRYSVDTRTRAPGSPRPRLPSSSVARARCHIGNSVSTIIPRTIRKIRRTRGSM